MRVLGSEQEGLEGARARRRVSRSNRISVMVVGARGIPDVEGGAEKNAEELFPRLALAGVEVTLLGLSKHIAAKSYRGVRLVAAPSSWLLKTDKLLYYIVAIGHALRLRPRIIHLQGLGAALFLWVYKLFGFRIVVRYGSADYLVGKWGLVGRLAFRFSEYQLRYADAVISVAESLSRRLASKGIRSRVHLIPNALDSSTVLWSPRRNKDRQYILAVGRVSAQKNVETLLAAFARLSLSHPHCELVVAGSLTDTAYVDSLAGLRSDNVRFLGAVPRAEVARLLGSCSLYVNLSLHEGNSNATLEAISSGCPVLVSDIPENRDMPLRPRNIVGLGDIDKIAASLAKALNSPTDYIVDRSGFITWDEVAQGTLRVYEAVS